MPKVSEIKKKNFARVKEEYERIKHEAKQQSTQGSTSGSTLGSTLGSERAVKPAVITKPRQTIRAGSTSGSTLGSTLGSKVTQKQGSNTYTGISKQKRLKVGFSVKIYDMLKKACGSAGVSMSEYVRMVVLQSLR